MSIRLACIGLAFAASAAVALSWGGAPTALDIAKTTPAEAAGPRPVAEHALDSLLAVEKRVSMDRLAGETWSETCLSRGDAPAPAHMATCWPAETDRNLGGSFINVRGEDGDCRQWRTTRPIVHRRFEDTLCLARADVPGLSLRDAGQIVDIE